MDKEKLDLVNKELEEVLKKHDVTLQVGNVIQIVPMPKQQEVTGTPVEPTKDAKEEKKG